MAYKRRDFGLRKVAPMVCIADGKQHVRKFLGGLFEEIGFVTCECVRADDLDVVLAGRAPDLFVLPVSVGGAGTAAMLEGLAAMAFGGTVLLIGPPDSVMASSVREFGEQRGLAMLPTLSTPFDHAGLRDSVAPLLPVGATPRPVIDAAEALNAGWLELWYQPRFEASTLRPCGTEARVRVRHPTWGVASPASFRHDAGDPCHSVLGDFVIRQAVEDWRSFVACHREVEIAVRLPIAFFREPEAIPRLARQLPDHPAFHGLIIEIDAIELLRDLDLARALARQLRSSKIAIAIDDVGPEWPSLAALEDFPFAEVKVDRRFVTGCAEDRSRQTICRRIRELADHFGARTVADGVESPLDFFAVRDLDFDLVQGGLFAKPMAPQTFARTPLHAPMMAAPAGRRPEVTHG